MDIRTTSKNGFYVNLKKYRFHKDEVQILDFIILANGIKMKEEKIEAIKDWLESKSVRYIQVFLSFANFNKMVIKIFSRIVSLLTLIHQITSDNELDL